MAETCRCQMEVPVGATFVPPNTALLAARIVYCPRHSEAHVATLEANIAHGEAERDAWHRNYNEERDESVKLCKQLEVLHARLAWAERVVAAAKGYIAPAANHTTNEKCLELLQDALAAEPGGRT